MSPKVPILFCLAALFLCHPLNGLPVDSGNNKVTIDGKLPSDIQGLTPRAMLASFASHGVTEFGRTIVTPVTNMFSNVLKETPPADIKNKALTDDLEELSDFVVSAEKMAKSEIKMPEILLIMYKMGRILEKYDANKTESLTSEKLWIKGALERNGLKDLDTEMFNKFKSFEEKFNAKFNDYIKTLNENEKEKEKSTIEWHESVMKETDPEKKMELFFKFFELKASDGDENSDEDVVVEEVPQRTMLLLYTLFELTEFGNSLVVLMVNLVSNVLKDTATARINNVALAQELEGFSSFIVQYNKTIEKSTNDENNEFPLGSMVLFEKNIALLDKYDVNDTSSFTPEQLIIKDSLDKNGFKDLDAQVLQALERFERGFDREFDYYIKSLNESEKQKEQPMLEWYETLKKETDVEKKLNIFPKFFYLYADKDENTEEKEKKETEN